MEEFIPYMAKPARMGRLTVKNRFSTLPMESNDAAPDGRPSELTIDRYRRLAAGGWGVVYVEAISPDERGKSRTRQLVLTESNLDSFRLLVDTIRAAADPPPVIIFQINHGGRYALRTMFAYHSELLDPTWNITPDMPPATTAELDEAAAASARAVSLAASAGADAADLKCCHGYLAAELFRPANNRDDRYGSTLENRLRYFDAVLESAVAAARDSGLLFGARISIHERVPGGIGSAGADGRKFSFDGATPLLERLKSAGANFVCETMGIPYLDPFVVRPHAGQEDLGEILAAHHGMAGYVKSFHPGFTVIGAGYTPYGPESISYGGKNIISGDVDLIGFGRQSFADPDTPKKVLGGDAGDVIWCKACKRNNCSTLLRANSHVGCVIHDKHFANELKKLKEGGKDA